MERGETVLRIYCMRKESIFIKKKKGGGGRFKKRKMGEREEIPEAAGGLGSRSAHDGF